MLGGATFVLTVMENVHSGDKSQPDQLIKYHQQRCFSDNAVTRGRFKIQITTF